MTYQTSRAGTTQVIVIGAGSVAITNAFGAQTRQIRLATNQHCHYHVYDPDGSATAVAATDPLLGSPLIEYVTVTPGQKISVIQAATGGLITAGTGTLWVTELISA
jgi:hypothetical protein